MVSVGLKQSASKEEFVRALGLDLSKPVDSAVFKEMWEEVTNYWNRNFETSANRTILKPEYAGNDKIQKPYKWAHLEPNAIDNAIASIWQTARPAPRRYYDLGRSEDRRIYNWVLKWLLWHVCRYRDWRNRKTKPQQEIIRAPLTMAVASAAVIGRKRRASTARLLDDSTELKRRRPNSGSSGGD